MSESFNSLGLAPYLVKAIADAGFKKPYAIQEQAVPAILKRKDVLGIAQTGSGKTAAYVLPVLMNLKGQTETDSRHINVLVLVPTRELALQVEEVFSLFGKSLPYPFKSKAVYGGASINPQMKGLLGVNVLVATPGRLLELTESNAVHFSKMSTLILDEADKMLSLGFKLEMDRIFALLPKKRQNLLFSATLNTDVQKVGDVLLQNPTIIKIAQKAEDIRLTKQLGYFVSPEKKGPLLRYLIRENNWQQVLVFTSSVYQADLVAEKLKKNNLNARAIHSKKSQGSRREALADFKSAKLRILVATDLLARGIDIAFLPHVVNYELPRSPKDFIHRIGRTGRAENPGEALTFVSPEDEHHFRVIQKKMKTWVTRVNSENIDLTGA
jgi:ATP-dependent RNA helicase RhlE